MDRNELVSWLQRIEQKVGDNSVKLATYNTLLEEHIRRTALLEEEMKPVKKHVSLVQNGFFLAGGVGAVLLWAHHMNIL